MVTSPIHVETVVSHKKVQVFSDVLDVRQFVTVPKGAKRAIGMTTNLSVMQ
jgi:hypothetical protein